MSVAEMTLNDHSKDVLLHTLGSSHPSSPLGWRNYYCGLPNDPDCEPLVALGLMCRGCVDGSKYQFYHATEKGILLARELAQPSAQRLWIVRVPSICPDTSSVVRAATRSKARYQAFLNIRGLWPHVRLIDIKVTTANREEVQRG
jgi:hypothetical protein